MQIVTGRRGEPHVTSRQMQAVYRSFLGDFALLDIGEKLRAEAYSDDIVRVYDGVVSVQGIYAVIAYNQYDEVYIEPVSVGKKRIDTIVLHYTKDNTLDVEDMQLGVVQGEEYTDNPVPPTISEGGDAWEGTTDIQVPIYDVEVTNFGLTVTPYSRMLTVIPTLESIAERIPETVVTGVKGDSEVLYRDGDVNITKANIGLGNVDNTADTDKPISTATQTALNLKADLTYVDAKIAAAYHAGGSKTVAELTSALLITDNMGKVYNMSDSGVTTADFVEGAGEPIREGDNVGICNVGTEESPVYKFDLLSGFVDLSAYATTSAVNTGLAEKVDKVTGKGLSTNDYTNEEKQKNADNASAIEDIQEDISTSLTFMSRERRNITSDLGRLSTAVSEQNLPKYGYKIGDYFTGASGYTYILADYNTFKGTSTPYCITSNHLGIVVDTHATSQWHSGDASAVGYNGSTLHTYLKGTVLDNIKADMIYFFGGTTGLEHLLSHSKLLTTALANWGWQANQYISALTCTQIDAGSQWTVNGFQEGEASKSLELFRKHKWTEIFESRYPWLRNLSNYSGGSDACYAGDGGALYGSHGVTGAYYVVGLIIFH